MTGFSIAYDPRLPITAHRAEILEALERHSVIVVAGATGSGKSTQLPKILLEAGRGAKRIIGHTQPRRIAARALASRIADELGSTVGGAVGYQVRFTDHTGPQTRVKLMTDGILLKELESDRRLNRYDTLIIDEAHERSLNIDLLLGVLKKLTRARADLKVIVTSATIDPERFSRFFDGAPIIEVSGRSYPVEVRYRPLIAEDEDAAELSLPEGVVQAVRELDGPGDVLVFLPGEKHIREAADALQRAALADTEVLQLFARLSAKDQERIFEKHTRRRIVLATNVAETSLTVPGIRFVVDSGLARISRYSIRGKVQRLPIERISQASADQRKGRCGREAAGICIRLYSQEDFELREAFTPPEILRTNLASVILRLAVLNLGEPEDFPFLDPPDNRLVNDGVRLLQELKAMDEERRVTTLGRRLASLPLDPRLARMLFAAAQRHCLTEMLIIAAFLEVQDPRERPSDAQKAADEKHAVFADNRSDFIAALNLWRMFNEQAAVLSGNQLRKWCREHFLSFMRMREWQELHAQLTGSVKELDLRRNDKPARYSDLHQAILTGFLSAIGHLDERREYVGARGTRFVIAPGTPLASRRPRWVVAGSLVETSRLFARMVASVQPQWIEGAGSHLLKRNYSDPHWVEAHGFVAAYESVSLYGLTLAARRRVSYGSVAPVEAREIFAREALAEGKLGARAGFLEANRRLRADIERMEAKIRRRDILIDEQTQTNFYLARLPERMSTLAAFERWRTEAERADPQLLFMSPADLMRREASEAGSSQFPDELVLHSNRLPLIYRFEPAAPDDGVTLVVPELLVELLDADRLAWLTPGLRLEKITAVLRALPKALRKQFVPVPEYAKAAFEELSESVYADEAAPGLPSVGFNEWMARWITRHGGATLSAQEIAALSLPDHLRLNIRVIDAGEHIVIESRDLAEIKRRLRIANLHVSGTPLEPSSPLHRQWDFGELRESTDVTRGRLRLLAYPALEDRGAGVALIEARSAVEADALSRRGMVRLAMLSLPQHVKTLRKRIAEDRDLVLLSQGLALEKPLADALTERAFRECFVPDDAELPRDRQAFEARLDARRADLHEVSESLIRRITALLKEWRAIRTTVGNLRSPVFANAVADIETQLDTLMTANFIESTPQRWFDEFPRYLKAIARRLDRLPGNVERDTELAKRAGPFAQALRALESQPASNTARAALEQLRWMIEEFRVSLYAQELRTVLPVSEKRLTEQLDRARAALRS
jgi:ATP-dependent helicase HrpA